jgi:cobalt-precorrin-6B (C15)-methyltransferase
MSRVALPHDAKAGPTKSEVRAVLLGKLDLGSMDHFVEIGSCTGAVTVEAARRAGRITALERKPERLAVAEKNLAANDVTADVELREAEAPEDLPEDADALFLGGSRNDEAVLDHAVATGVGRLLSLVELARFYLISTNRIAKIDTSRQQIPFGYHVAYRTW